MRKYLNRSSDYQSAIREILMKEWDPIDVFDIPEAKDEYDSYIPHIYSQLIHDKSEQEIFNNLWEIETVYMGLYGNRQRTNKVVKLLIELRKKIEKN